MFVMWRVSPAGQIRRENGKNHRARDRLSLSLTSHLTTLFWQRIFALLVSSVTFPGSFTLLLSPYQMAETPTVLFCKGCLMIERFKVFRQRMPDLCKPAH